MWTEQGRERHVVGMDNYDLHGRKLIGSLLIAVLMGAGIGMTGCSKQAPPAHTQVPWVPPGKAQELKDMLPSTNPQELSEGKAFRSTSAAQHALVVFHNETAATLDLFWLDYQGQRKKYGTISAGAYEVEDTFVTHPWLLADASGNPVALFVSLPGNSIATIK